MDVLLQIPIVFTKDHDWASQWQHRWLKSGSIVVLPKDAILVFAPESKVQPEVVGKEGS